jgi:hypothetical protein
MDQIHVLSSSDVDTKKNVRKKLSSISDDLDSRRESSFVEANNASSLARNLCSRSPDEYSNNIDAIYKSIDFSNTSQLYRMYSIPSDIKPFAFDEPSPDDIVMNARSQAIKQTKKGMITFILLEEFIKF